MFVDIEGCTKLCERLSPSRMERVMEEYFSRYLDLVRFAGGEVTEILGDGLLAVFEGPSLWADSVRAARAAVAIQESTRELNGRPRRHRPIVVNVGLNAGAEWIGLTRLRGRSGERWAYRAIGPVINVAARLCELAEHGQILVSGTVARLIADSVLLRGLGRRRLKNIARPVAVFEVVTRTSASPPSAPPTRRRSTPTGVASAVGS